MKIVVLGVKNKMTWQQIAISGLLALSMLAILAVIGAVVDVLRWKTKLAMYKKTSKEVEQGRQELIEQVFGSIINDIKKQEGIGSEMQGNQENKRTRRYTRQAGKYEPVSMAKTEDGKELYLYDLKTENGVLRVLAGESEYTPRWYKTYASNNGTFLRYEGKRVYLGEFKSLKH